MDLRAAQLESTTAAARVKSKRGTDDDTAMQVRGCPLTTRSLSVPAVTDSTRRRRLAVDRSAEMTSGVASTARVDSGVSGMQSGVSTPSTSNEDRADTDAGGSAVWNLSDMSLDVHSCPDGVTQLPPLFLWQYVNGFSDALLMHVVDRCGHDAVCSTTATHCAVGQQPSASRVESVPVPAALPRGALAVQTTAVVERRPTSADDTDSPCFCGRSHRHSDPADGPSPTASIHGPPAPPCDVVAHRRWPSTDSQDHGRTLISPGEVDRRRLLTRLLLGRHEELTLSPVYCDETYF